MNRPKLPKLVLNNFRGDAAEWMTFWDSFESAVHKNPELSDIDKFIYLRSLLGRSALDAISGLSLTAANYAEAIAMLKKRFGNRQQIISRHMDILLSLAAVTSEHNVKGLRRLYDTIESHIRSLKSLGVPADSYGGLLTSVLLTKLPSELRLIVSRSTGEREWDLDGVMTELAEELEAREIASVSSHTHQPRRSTRERDQSTASTLLSGGSMPMCCYCQRNHPSGSCGVVTAVEERRKKLREAGRCFICLRRGHLARLCHSKKKCAHCSGRHHDSICSRVAPPRQRLDSTLKLLHLSQQLVLSVLERPSLYSYQLHKWMCTSLRHPSRP